MPFNVRPIELENNKIFWQRLSASHLLEDQLRIFQFGEPAIARTLKGGAALPYKEDGVLIVSVGKVWIKPLKRDRQSEGGSSCIWPLKDTSFRNGKGFNFHLWAAPSTNNCSPSCLHQNKYPVPDNQWLPPRASRSNSRDRRKSCLKKEVRAFLLSFYYYFFERSQKDTRGQL